MTTANNNRPLLPYLCSATTILALVLVGELLALVITLADFSTTLFSWYRFGATSMLVQWIILCSCMVLCQLHPVLNRLPPLTAGGLAYGLCVLINGFVLWLAQWLTPEPVNGWLWGKSLLIGAICSGILLRYLYVQQQLINRQQAESEARFDALQARIRPHFLFNAMNTIASLISIDPEKAETLVEDLSEVFRASLKQTGLVALADEIALCERYVAIEQLRLDERLQVQWQYPRPLPAVQVPSLLLQPLIENAIVHGIQRLVDGGVIAITISDEPQRLTISVTNPLPQLPASTTERGNRMALSNIQHRLAMHFGNGAGFTTQSDNDNYTVVITIPH